MDAVLQWERAGGVRRYGKNLSISEITDMLEENEDTIQKIYDAAVKYAPDYDVDKIAEELIS